MKAKALIIGTLTATLALIAAGVAPASAEFFGCNEPHTKVTYSPGYYPHRSASRQQYVVSRWSRHPAYSVRHVDRRDRASAWR